MTDLTPLKPFQKATVEVAVRALSDGRRKVRRFLVADEVGLGKTVVAQHVLWRLMCGQTRPFTVFYVCSNLSIAAQNKSKLLQVIPEVERDSAVCQVDRLTLLPASTPPSHPNLRLYTLTPETSVPVRHGRRRDGRQEERALLQALIEDAFPGLIETMSWNAGFFQRSARSRWKTLLGQRRAQLAAGGLRASFREAVREAFALAPGQWLQTRLRGIRDELEIIAGFRTALAIQALNRLTPDLVIFDEFQRFRDLLDDDVDVAASRIVRVLRGETGSRLLMLSATPYSLLTSRAEDAAGQAHHEQFLDLIRFLHGGRDAGDSKVAACRESFSQLERVLHKGDFDAEQGRRAIEQVESLLRPVMARTERLMHPLGSADGHTQSVPAQLSSADLQSYRQFAESLQPHDRPHAPAYWSSIPMPMQTMGARYEVWARAKPAQTNGLVGFDESQRNGFLLPGPWPHPKLRALMAMATPERLALPWIAPSLPWWELSGPWRQANRSEGKLLIFSRFRAVPPAVSAALCFGLERKYLRGKGFDYTDVSKRRMLQATGERVPLIAAFHPCTLLSRNVDPLAANSTSRKAVRNSIRQQLTRLIRDELGIKIETRPGRPRPIWQLLAALETAAGGFIQTLNAWSAIQRQSARVAVDDSAPPDGSESSGGLAKLLERWQAAGTRPASITTVELDELVTHAWSAPGVVLARAVGRYWPEAFEPRNADRLIAASWLGLRTYLDQRWFAAALGGSERNYLRALQAACVGGNLESVLDEWFWLLSTTQGRKGADLCDEVLNVSRLRGSDVHLHDVEHMAKSFTVRAHAALPFIDSRQRQLELEAEAKPLRNDELRRAFNSPFHPHVLTTTSVGQEGLDFHAWCRTVVHWDLPPNAADLEQREGRIQRFAGLAVRREVANRVGAAAFEQTSRAGSPWSRVAIAADREMGDDSGLAPWWVCEGAQINRCVLDVPISEQRVKLEQLHAQRGLYRIVLGQPYQEDLLAVLKQRQAEGKEIPTELMPLLSPYFQRQKGNAG